MLAEDSPNTVYAWCEKCALRAAVTGSSPFYCSRCRPEAARPPASDQVRLALEQVESDYRRSQPAPAEPTSSPPEPQPAKRAEPSAGSRAARRLKDVVCSVLPGPAPEICDSLTHRWRGAGLYLPLRTARLRWRGRAPHGAAENFATDLAAAILDRGGTTADARVVLAALAGRRFFVS